MPRGGYRGGIPASGDICPDNLVLDLIGIRTRHAGCRPALIFLAIPPRLCYLWRGHPRPAARSVLLNMEERQVITMSLKQTSKYLSLILRHQPEAAGITLDEHGWADVDELIAGVSKTRPFDRAMLEEIVATDEKQRYSFSEDGTRIRANQGHSVPVDVELEQRVPPDVLFHGTGEKSVSSIELQGLLPGSRLYVHLSPDAQTARKVGSRHGRPVVYTVDSGAMARDGYVFYLSANGVWLTKEVPPRYLRQMTPEADG